MENNQVKDQEKINRYRCLRSQSNRIIAAIIIIAIIGFIAQSVARTSAIYKNPSTISVTGIGKVNAVPDISTISFTLRSANSDSDTQALQKDISTQANSVISKLTGLGIDEKDIQTSNYSVNPKYSYANGQSTIDGYEASESINVKVRDLTKVSTVLDILATEKVTDVNGPQFTVDDMQKIRDEARDQAIIDAKSKAKDLAQALGVKIDRIISYDDNSAGGGIIPPMPMYNSAAKALDSSVSSQPNLPTGQQEVTVNATITFQITN